MRAENRYGSTKSTVAKILSGPVEYGIIVGVEAEGFLGGRKVCKLM